MRPERVRPRPQRGLERRQLRRDRQFAGVNDHALDDVPTLAELVEHGLAVQSDEGLRLTDAGMEWSDSIGPWLYSSTVRTLMERYELR